MESHGNQESIPKKVATELVHNALSAVIESVEILEIKCAPEDSRGAERAKRQILNALKRAELDVLVGIGRQ